MTAGIGDMFVAPRAAPLCIIELCFDGGCSASGHGYGSYTFWINGNQTGPIRHEFGVRHTSNASEWDILRHGLEAAVAAVDPVTTKIDIRGDSRLVVEGAAGRWKVSAPHLKPIAAEVRRMLGLFAEANLQWWPRENSVRIFGH